MSATHIIKRRAVPSAAPAELEGLHPLLQRIYLARHIDNEAALEHTLHALAPAEALAHIDRGVQLLCEALAQEQRILVVGDFDADGATSTALALRALRTLGAADVHYLVPNRFEYGYGLTPEIVAAAQALSPDLIVTVDNGVSSLEGVEAAQAAGIKVLVTDHHLPGATLPTADAIVNPNLPGDRFPSKHLAGVGVIFYVMLALRSELRRQGWFQRRGLDEPNMAQFLDLVALGTVADVVPLDHNNRVLVEQGLRRIRAGQCIPGIAALLQVAGRNRERLVASDLGFAVGPRLNAAGRLEDMSVGIECLLTNDRGLALALATRLDTLNRERREIESEMQAQALSVLDRLREELDEASMPVGLTLFDEDWHQGVIGILASRIKDRFHRPVIAFAPAGEEELKGSARSIPGLHIRDALDSLAAAHPGLITKFGGHAMAAGLSLPRGNFAAFREAFDQTVRERVDPDDLQGVIHSDGELGEEELSLEVAEMLRNAGPWGQGFPEPLFDGEFEIVQRRIVGERHLKLVLRPVGARRVVDAIAFYFKPEDWPQEQACVRIAYRLDVNEYQGVRSVQLIVQHVEAGVGDG